MKIMIQSEKKITYFFYEGREEKINNKEYSKEFFYGYMEAQKNFKKLNLVEIPKESSESFLFIIDKVFFKLASIQFNLSKYLNKKIIFNVKNSEVLILTNFGMALSLMPLISVLNLRKKKKIYVINSGLFNFQNANIIQNKLRNLYLNFFFKAITAFVFTSKQEYLYAKENYQIFHKNFVLKQYCCDFNFWNDQNSITKFNKKYDLLFIGNDSGRDFKLLIDLAKQLVDYRFCIVSKNQELNILNSLPNVDLISGNWSNSEFTDQDIKLLYLKSKITILPILDTLVASGQSVTLQSMASGTPVLISNTKGFWDKDLFRDNKEIFFCKEDNVNEWMLKINTILENQEILDNVAKNGQELIQKKFDIPIFNDFFINLIKS